jgi:hypothetical protein
MGTSVTQALVDAIGGEGNMVMTSGPLGFSAVQGRSKAFESVVKKFPKINVLDTAPADRDVTKTARILETWLYKYPKIDAAFFQYVASRINTDVFSKLIGPLCRDSLRLNESELIRYLVSSIHKSGLSHVQKRILRPLWSKEFRRLL